MPSPVAPTWRIELAKIGSSATAAAEQDSEQVQQDRPEQDLGAAHEVQSLDDALKAGGSVLYCGGRLCGLPRAHRHDGDGGDRTGTGAEQVDDRR